MKTLLLVVLLVSSCEQSSGNALYENEMPKFIGKCILVSNSVNKRTLIGTLREVKPDYFVLQSSAGKILSSNVEIEIIEEVAPDDEYYGQYCQPRVKKESKDER